MSYKGLKDARDASVPHLGGNIIFGDPFTFCPSVWDYVISRFGVETALDLGSGCGNAALYFHNRGVRVLAVDGYIPNVMSSIYPAIQHDITTGPIVTKVDLVHCQEVVEHIDEQYINALMGSMLCGKVILMTHALPGQTGYHHVNLQPPEYWIRQFELRGGVLLEEDTRRIRQLAEKDGALFMRATGMIFSNRNSK
jgi:hypothetical protein